MWQPIETAPKTGERIDIWDAKYQERIADCYWKDDAWWAPNMDYDGEDGVYSGGNDPALTHWMSRPDPPT